VIAISGSGNSENVIRAVDYANENGAVTLGLCGFSGGKLKQKAQNICWVNANDMQLCEDTRYSAISSCRSCADISNAESHGFAFVVLWAPLRKLPVIHRGKQEKYLHVD
jgi:fructoselysine-6-P-deglycase FrlB-like protein